MKLTQQAHVHAECGDGLQVQRAGADAHADPRVAQEGEQPGDRDDDHATMKTRYQVMKNSSELSGCDMAIGHAERQSVRPPDVTADILDDEGEAEGQQQAVDRIAVVDSADHQALDDQAQHRGEDRRDQQRAPEADDTGVSTKAM